MQTNLVISSYIKRVTILAQAKAKNVRDSKFGIVKKYPRFLKSMTWKIKYDWHYKINVKRQLQNCELRQ